MAGRDRHGETVRAVATAHGVKPVGPAQVRAPGSARIDALRAEARDALAGAEQAAAAARTEVEDATAAHDGALARLDAAERAVAGAEATLRSTRAAVEEERRRLDEVEHAIRDLEARLVEDTERREQLTDLAPRLDAALDAVVGRPLDPTVLDGRDSLTALARAMSATGLDDGAVAVAEWAEALGAGTAPPDDGAAQLREALAVLREAWAGCGAGNVGDDPAVMAARAELLAAQTAIAELDSHARTGALGEQVKRAIETAHHRRTELEARGRKADPSELDAARAAESEALRRVGFDSMLDFRIVMSTSGTGSLAGKRREIAEDELATAQAHLDAALGESRRRHEDLRTRLDRAEARALAVTGAPDAAGADDALARMFSLPVEVQHARDELQAAAARSAATVAEHQAEVTELTRQRDHARSRIDELLAAADEAVGAVDDAGARRQEADAAVAACAAEVHAAEVAHAVRSGSVEDARTALAGLDAQRYTESDVIDLREHLLEVLAEHTAVAAEAGDVVVVDDPLGVLDVADARRVFDDVRGREWPAVVLFVTSSPELLAMAPGGESRLRCIDGRRRYRDARRGARSDGLLSGLLRRRHRGNPEALAS